MALRPQILNDSEQKDELFLSQKGLQPVGKAAAVKIRALEKERDQARLENEQVLIFDLEL
jgi:hypothetical protein